MKRERVGWGKIHLQRWVLFRCRYFQIVVHNFLRDDPPDMHNHAWWNVSLVLRGALREHTLAGTRELRAGSVVMRPAAKLHRLQVLKPAWTLFITGPAKREWGYQTPRGWVHWTDYRLP